MFGKIFESLYKGSMVDAGPYVFAVWPYVIATQRPAGGVMYVELNPKILAFVIGKGTTEQQVQEAIDFLCAPDTKSRCRDEDGRRLVKEGAFLYRVVNGHFYREIRNEEERRVQLRNAQRRFRSKGKTRKDGKEPGPSAEYMDRERRAMNALENGDVKGFEQIAGEGIDPGR